MEELEEASEQRERKSTRNSTPPPEIAPVLPIFEELEEALDEREQKITRNESPTSKNRIRTGVPFWIRSGMSTNCASTS